MAQVRENEQQPQRLKTTEGRIGRVTSIGRRDDEQGEEERRRSERGDSQVRRPVFLRQPEAPVCAAAQAEVVLDVPVPARRGEAAAERFSRAVQQGTAHARARREGWRGHARLAAR